MITPEQLERKQQGSVQRWIKRMIEREPRNKWQKLVKPIVESCEVAAAFDHELVWTGEGAGALGKLLETMAKNLDEFNEISRQVMINQL